MALLRYLQLPYPYYYSFTRSLFVAIGSGLFVFLFLIIFQPFGTYNFGHPYKIAFLAGYGFITTLVMIAWLATVPLAFPKVFEEERWTIGKQLSLLLLLVISLATAGYFYKIRFFDLGFDWQNWAYFNGLTISVGFFPLLIITLFDYAIKFKKYHLPSQPLNQKQETIINDSKGLYVLSDDQLKDKVVFSEEELLFIKASDNYIEIFLRRGKTDFDKKLIRTTLKSAETTLLPLGLMKCHRSYLVNLKNCTSINGNSQGYKLSFEGVPEAVPVSRSKKDEISQFLK